MAFQGVLLDITGGARLSSGETLSLDALKKSAELLTVYLNRYVGTYWGVPGGALIRAGNSSSDLRADEIPSFSRPTINEAPDAIAYHTVNGFGIPAIEEGFSLSNGLWIPGGWLSSQSHEWAETLVDPAANLWSAAGDGNLYALEACDAVEVQCWELKLPDGTSGWMSNFLLPAFFRPGAPPPYDYMTAAGISGAVAPRGPFQTAAGDGGNYQLVKTNSSDGHQVRAEGDVSRRATKKAHPSSRAYRRGLRLGVAA